MRNIVGLSIGRGLAATGGAFVVPNAVALLGINIPPGRTRNIAMGIFGAMAPIGAAGGGVFGGLFSQFTDWKWLFFFFFTSLLHVLWSFVVVHDRVAAHRSELDAPPVIGCTHTAHRLGCSGGCPLSLADPTHASSAHLGYWRIMLHSLNNTRGDDARSAILLASAISGNHLDGHQGIAVSLIGTIISYGQSIGLGFAGTVEKYISSENSDLVDGYRHALYFGIGLGGAALILDLIFVQVEADKKEGWATDSELRSNHTEEQK
ncbi:hypothetical protein CSAL01_12541 [Colletotrichum salicis]|uniref:Major facilitator superfamily (MFS) profile domain-containing protein n=1 Tax=Colletotrichum salicis TaxID=1209931 RepID=A0A135VAA0_9PEZI|nr:hypothetical protein CSAL01_12541 [Colletotrichum salicis]